MTYTRRELRDITAHALHRLSAAPDYLASDDTRAKAHAALEQLQGQREPERRDLLAVWPVQPGLDVAAEDSGNILLILREPGQPGAEIARTGPLSDIGAVTNALELARAWVAAEEEATRERQARLDDAMVLRGMPGDGERPGENPYSLAAAMAALVRAGLGARAVRYVIRRAYGHASQSFDLPGTGQPGTVTYDREHGTYAVRVPDAPVSAPVATAEPFSARGVGEGTPGPSQAACGAAGGLPGASAARPSFFHPGENKFRYREADTPNRRRWSQPPG